MSRDRPRVLVVDDVAHSLRAVASVLDGIDADVVTAGSGAEAVSLLLRGEFAVVLLDVMMPDMNGFEVAELLRANRPTAHVPIIFITGVDPDARRVFEGYERGAVDYLLKPLDPVILRSKVDVFLRLFRQTQALAVLADLRRTQQELARAHRDLESFVSSIFHDLREPALSVSVALGASEAELAGAADAEVARWLGSARAHSDRLLAALDALREYVDAGAADTTRVAVDLNDTLASVLAELAPKIQAAGARVEVGPLPTISGRPSQLHLLFAHLLDNAIKFRSPERDPEIDVSAPAEAGATRLVVRDNGLGIQKPEREDLFRPFVHLRRRDDYEGAHLGLAICRRIVEAHGGSIQALDHTGPGASIEVRFATPAGEGGRNAAGRPAAV